MSIIEFAHIDKPYCRKGIFGYLLKVFEFKCLENCHQNVKIALFISDQSKEYREELAKKVYAKYGFFLFRYAELPSHLLEQLVNIDLLREDRVSTDSGELQQYGFVEACFRQYWKHHCIGMLKRGHHPGAGVDGDSRDILSTEELAEMGFEMTLSGGVCSVCASDDCSGGKCLVRCSSCYKHYHNECHRPLLDSIGDSPADANITCSYCSFFNGDDRRKTQGPLPSNGRDKAQKNRRTLSGRRRGTFQSRRGPSHVWVQASLRGD